ncbi:drug resistance transporter, EmrB/QacA subfamily [Friedmanniella luteola]|uniref:Drug resistance transporter, EmrB/QacA subfamily n=1 Tax=Friedmanniella luteola TaxID=546871 RepID=A0A1H1VWF6_9ACTN|nr:MFS transporter [Friedmanniella luteola]SDS89035.1 drug resistance transporter, EmrB/QacA subfamily [Friedmanniella luteola]
MTASAPSRPLRRRSATLNRPLALLVAGTFFMENLDGTVIATAAPAIASDLGVAPVDINLAMTAYLVTIAVGIPISGWLTDRFGGRRVLVTAIAVFTVASLLCALSTTLPVLVGMRVLQGVGGALMVPVGRLVVLRVTTKQDLLDAVAYLTWPALVAPVIAPALGGWIVSVASWHWIFLINLPLGVVALVVAARIVPSLDGTPSVPPLDLVGFGLCAGTLAALLVGLELLGPQHVGGALAPAGTLVVAALLGLLTALWLRRTPHPLLRFGALRLQSFRVSNLGGGVYRMVISAVPFLLPLMFQVGFGWSPVQAGLLVLLLFLGNVAIKPATSPLIRTFGFRSVLIASIVGGLLVFVAIAMLRPGTPLVVTGAVLVLSGVFRSVGFSAYNSLQFADLDTADMTDANTLASTLQQVAVGLGVAVGAVVLRVVDLTAGPGRLDPVTPYAITFGVLAVLMLHPLVEALVLHRSAGDEVAGR